MNTSNDCNELNGTETTGGRGEDVLIVRMRRALAIGLATLAVLASSASARADEPLSPIVPFVIPNGKPTEAEIREIVRTLHANGHDQFMTYPSTGLDYEYLGEDFFRMIGWFLDEARRLGLKVWLYDEFNWPSGTARGRVPAENENCLYRELVAVTNAAGDVSWQFLVSREMNVDSYCLDTNNLEPESAERFLDLTHRAYSPKVASGRIPVVITLLSPANRPIQVTKDLAGFWVGAYQMVRKDMRGRYPKHNWPEDPLSAVASKRTLKRKE